MRSHVSVNALLLGAAACVLVWVPTSRAQVVNPNFELPADGATGTDTVATGWTLDPAVGDSYTNPGSRCQFDTPTPSGGTWSLWLQTFVQYGDANQVVTGVTPGVAYNLTAQLAFQVGSTPGTGYNAVTLVNQASDTKSQDTGDLYSYLEVEFQNAGGTRVGSIDYTLIPAGSITAAPVGQSTPFATYTVTGVAPAGATQALVEIGWDNGGLDNNTGGQSAFATDVSFGVVPEPASLSLISMGGVALLARRRRARTA
jgi:hypothetical protein